MNKTKLILCALVGALPAMAAEPMPPATETSAASNGPHVVFDKTALDFGKVESGELVKHTFFFTNTGNQLLEVREVRPSCGCTTAGAWDKQVEPGKFGSIPVQFNSTGYGGAVHKTVTVVCNDSSNSNAVLHLTGTIWKPIDVTPAFASFNFGPDVQTNDTRVLRVINNLSDPVTVSEPNSGNPAFKPELKTVKEGKEYELRVTVIPPFDVPSISTPITLKTSYGKMPVLNVTAFVVIQPAISAVPTQLSLPAGPLTNDAKFTVTLRNNSTNSVVLSEPKVNVEGAEAKLKELDAGKQFELSVIFPTGFQSQPGQPVEVSVQSNSPKLPIVKIPVYQAAAPAKVTAPTPAASAKAPAAGVTDQPKASTATIDALHSASNSPGPTHGPKIEFATTSFDFGRIESGKVVNHVFEFSNTGDQLLEIRDVWTSCGCTAATNWTRQVEPGKSGKIPIIFDSGGKEGPLTKTVSLVCNDPAQPKAVLQFTATVWKPIDALPTIAAFTFGPDFQTNETRIIRLVNNLDEPVTISEPICTNSSFRTKLTTVKEGKEFELRVTLVPPVPAGTTLAPITLKTSSPKMPVVTVTGYAMAQPALAIMPPRINLFNELPLTDPAEFTVRIQNQSTNALALSEPTITAKTAQVRLRELQPGRLFELVISFPAGFQTQPGEDIEARVKSNHPQFPIVKVPVMLPMQSLPATKPGVSSAQASPKSAGLLQ